MHALPALPAILTEYLTTGFQRAEEHFRERGASELLEMLDTIRQEWFAEFPRVFADFLKNAPHVPEDPEEAGTYFLAMARERSWARYPPPDQFVENLVKETEKAWEFTKAHQSPLR